ncbi:MAG TPA: peptidoglycan DD-metalloendopeptidase family protein [Rudaea sp.]|nr:peptidoglycan DD-metalloendopeptidase family protein [Rudaea sp.]
MTRYRASSSRVTSAALQLWHRAQRAFFQIYTSGAGRRLQSAISKPASWRREHWVLAGLACAIVILVGATLPTGASATRSTDASVTTLDLPLPVLTQDDAPTAPEDSAAPDAFDDAGSWSVITVRSGQTVGDIFHQNGLNPGILQQLLGNSANAAALRNVHPGDELAFLRAADGSLRGLRFDRDEHTRVVVSLGVDGLHQQVIDRQIERRTHVAHGVVEHSLFDAGAQAGMSDAMVLKLANAFGYDIDFAQDLRQGDSFTVIYDDVYREGERLHDGEIVAATFINRGKRFSAFRYTDTAGNTMFYSDDGRPLRKAFLRTPVEFTRISSLFSAGRMHPILGTMRAHRGVDYAAPVGTPVHAAGDGKVVFRGWQNGYGNVLILQHGGHYSTLYGHMSRFASIRDGQRVSQGQTIGYVGMTGLATGPHLHYEFRVDGTHRDPLSVTLPKPEPLPQVELARFHSQTQPMLARLKTLEATQVALAK